MESGGFALTGLDERGDAVRSGITVRDVRAPLFSSGVQLNGDSVIIASVILTNCSSGMAALAIDTCSIHLGLVSIHPISIREMRVSQLTPLGRHARAPNRCYSVASILSTVCLVSHSDTVSSVESSCPGVTRWLDCNSIETKLNPMMRWPDKIQLFDRNYNRSSVSILHDRHDRRLMRTVHDLVDDREIIGSDGSLLVRTSNLRERSSSGKERKKNVRSMSA